MTYLRTKGRVPKPVRRAVADYVAELQEAMRLAHWTVEVGAKYAHPSTAAHAVIWIADEAHDAEVWIAADFATYRRADQRHVLVHELCHLIMEPVNHAINRNSVPRGKDNQASDNIHPAMETAVDDYARLIEPHVPLPRRGWLSP